MASLGYCGLKVYYIDGKILGMSGRESFLWEIKVFKEESENILEAVCEDRYHYEEPMDVH